MRGSVWGLKEETVTGQRRLEKKERVRRAKKENRRRIHPETHLQKWDLQRVSHEEL